MKKYINKLALTGISVVTALQVMAGNVFAQLDPGEEIVAPKGFAQNIGSLINGGLTLIMIVGAFLVLVYLILGGIEWITSGGDKSKTESAQNKITNAVIGLIILAASYAILLIVLNFLGFKNIAEVFNSVKPITN